MRVRAWSEEGSWGRRGGKGGPGELAGGSFLARLWGWRDGRGRRVDRRMPRPPGREASCSCCVTAKSREGGRPLEDLDAPEDAPLAARA